jgi:hypothetical protein
MYPSSRVVSLFDRSVRAAAATGLFLAASSPAHAGDEAESRPPAAARAADSPAPPTAPLPAGAPEGPGHRTADYFPLAGARPSVYRKTTSYWRGRERAERLERTPAPLSEGVRVNDSEGEYQDYGLRGDAPAMEGQSMRAQGFTQRYEPALQLFPAEARPGERARFESVVKHTTGNKTTSGSVAREVVLEGVEDVTTPAGSFARCLRFRVTQENRPDEDGAFVARTAETVWLARGLGEVRSVARVSLETYGVPWLRATITTELEELGSGPAMPERRRESF